MLSVCNAVSAAGIQFRYYRKGAPGVPAILPREHPLPRLFAHVNPFHTYRDLLGRTALDLQVHGCAFWFLAPRLFSGVPGEIWPLLPQWVRGVPGGEGMFESYHLLRGGRTTVLRAQDVVHFQLPSVDSLYRGRGPLAAAVDAVNADRSVSRAKRRVYSAMPFPGGMYHSKVGLTKEQKDRAVAELKKIFARDAAEDGPSIVFLGEDDLFRTVDVAPATRMDFANAADSERDKILAIFGVPPPVLGLGNMKEGGLRSAFNAFSRNTIGPKLALLAAQITQKVAARFLPPDIEAVFTEAPLASDVDSTKELDVAMTHELLSTDEARARYFGLGPALEGDPVEPKGKPDDVRED